MVNGHNYGRKLSVEFFGLKFWKKGLYEMDTNFGRIDAADVFDGSVCAECGAYISWAR